MAQAVQRWSGKKCCPDVELPTPRLLGFLGCSPGLVPSACSLKETVPH